MSMISSYLASLRAPKGAAASTRGVLGNSGTPHVQTTQPMTLAETVRLHAPTENYQALICLDFVRSSLKILLGMVARYHVLQGARLNKILDAMRRPHRTGKFRRSIPNDEDIVDKDEAAAAAALEHALEWLQRIKPFLQKRNLSPALLEASAAIKLLSQKLASACAVSRSFRERSNKTEAMKAISDNHLTSKVKSRLLSSDSNSQGSKRQVSPSRAAPVDGKVVAAVSRCPLYVLGADVPLIHEYLREIATLSLTLKGKPEP